MTSLAVIPTQSINAIESLVNNSMLCCNVLSVASLDCLILPIAATVTWVIVAPIKESIKWSNIKALW